MFIIDVIKRNTLDMVRFGSAHFSCLCVSLLILLNCLARFFFLLFTFGPKTNSNKYGSTFRICAHNNIFTHWFFSSLSQIAHKWCRQKRNDLIALNERSKKKSTSTFIILSIVNQFVFLTCLAMCLAGFFFSLSFIIVVNTPRHAATSHRSKWANFLLLFLSLARARHRISFESLKFIPTVVYEYCHALWKCEISNKIKRHQPREMHEPWVPDIKWARMEKNTHNCTIVYVTMRERHK